MFVGVQDENKLLVLVPVSSAENRLPPGALETKLDRNIYSGLSIHYSKCDTYHKLVSCFRTNAPFHVKIGHIQMFQELTARGLSKSGINFYEGRLSYSEKVNKHSCRILSFFLGRKLFLCQILAKILFITDQLLTWGLLQPPGSSIIPD